MVSSRDGETAQNMERAKRSGISDDTKRERDSSLGLMIDAVIGKARLTG